MLKPGELLKMQQSEELKSALRSGKTGIKMLDDSDLNVGNQVVLNPTIIAPGGQLWTSSPPATTAIPRLLNLTSSSRTGQSVTVVLSAERVSAPNGFTGPITGIIEFGNGAVVTSIEFDVPPGPYKGDSSAVGDASSVRFSGAVVQIPSSIVRAFARYDNTLLTPILAPHSPVFGQAGDPSYGFINPLLGPFPPNATTDPSGTPLTAPVAPVLAQGFAAYFGRHHTKLYKTQYLYVGNSAAGGVTFGPQAGPPAPIPYAIPPYAKSVRLVRVPQTASLTLGISDLLAHVSVPGVVPPDFTETYTIPSGPMQNPIALDGHARVIYLQSASGGAGDQVTGVKLVYEIGF